MSILSNYKWTGKLTPFTHQKTTAAFLTDNLKAFCFNEQGTGKTASVIWAADYLMKQGLVKRVLVLCPLSIMQSAWQQDLFKFAMHRSCAVAHSSSSEARRKIVKSGAEFVIVNFDGAAIAKQEIIDGGFDLIVVDECFVAGTLVATPQGDRAIETLGAGDMVYTSSGVAHIRTVKRRESADIVEVQLRNGERITCTGEHPFFTDVGWVTARNLGGRRLISQFDMSCMRAQLSSPEAGMGLASEVRHKQVPLLLEILRTEEVAPSQSGEIVLRGHAPREEGEPNRVHEVFGDAATYIHDTESHRAQTKSARRQRDGDDTCRNLDTPTPTAPMGMELPCSVGVEAARLSYMLQAGFCGPDHQARSRGGRRQSHLHDTESTGQEEGSQTAGAWVESVSRIECGSSVSVFNLEVEGTPNYFVGGGWLVHNCNAYKNPQTKRWKVFRELSINTPRIWMLTGTPASQSPLDAYGLAKIVNPQGTPKYYGAYRDQVMYKVSHFRWIPKPTAKDVVHAVLQPAIRFEKKDCLDLPPVTYVERDAPMTPMQRVYYNKLRTQMAFDTGDESVTSVNAAVKMSKLLQIASGAVYTDTGEVIEFDVTNRLKVVLEVVEEASNKVLIFVPFTHTIELLQRLLEQHNITCAVINGGVPVNKRSQIVTEFQNATDPRVLIIQPQAASHGLTLTAADTIIWYAPVSSVETYLQANARIDRPGQKNAMTVYNIAGSEVERRLFAMLQANVLNHRNIIDLYRQVMASSA